VVKAYFTPSQNTTLLMFANVSVPLWALLPVVVSGPLIVCDPAGLLTITFATFVERFRYPALITVQLPVCGELNVTVTSLGSVIVTLDGVSCVPIRL